MDKHLENYYKRKIAREGSRYLEAKTRWLAGESLTSIEKELNFDRHVVSTLLKFEGYNIKKNGQKYTYNTHFFDEINTEEKAYWLGFLYADGEIVCMGHYALRLGLSIKDYSHIAALRDIICPNMPIIEYDALETKYHRYHRSARVTFCSKELVESLISAKCFPSKEQCLSIPFDIVPKNLIRHFIRGFFDGDGSTSAYKGTHRAYISFLSASKQIIKEIRDIMINEVGLNPTKLYCNKRSENGMTLYFFRNSAKKDIAKFYAYIYRDATICLERKKRIVENVLSYDKNSRPESTVAEGSETINGELSGKAKPSKLAC